MPESLWHCDDTLLRCRASDHLNEIAGADVAGKRSLHFVRIQFKVSLGGVNRLVERKPDHSPSEKASCHIILARLAERNLPQKQRLGLLQFGRWTHPAVRI